MLTTTHDTPTDPRGRCGARGSFLCPCACGDGIGMHDHDRPSGPGAMR